ncbi:MULTISPECIES: helix-turn-helix domain-containing protein [Legionella]|uniref:DNA-binding protein n=1 Tax=Legionella maceachernii TaxID=466 RepID=A0A0W0W8W1_9GAMM|nr:helix-turn-helix domain-containing protein [Legionella maceachernii]KTD28775.1 DNA-binding protein [Legionella maceachernii]SJZ70630.1 cytoskeleton protein RodZ [Legionella maceachernii]SUP02301.1 Cytoskeleton protein rodZ [Legionella maceachernii]
MTTVIMDEIHNGTSEKPGMQLARVREKKGYSQEYVAGKLHLRVRIIELLEADDYDQMPEPVFIKGYIRAYAKLLGVPVDPLLEIFNSMHSTERKLEKALWQSKRESNKGERTVRILTGLIAVAAVVAVGIWWQKNKDSTQIFSAKNAPVVAEQASKTEAEIRLTDLSKMRSMLTPNNSQITPLETKGG